MQGSMKAARFFGSRGPEGKQDVVRVEEIPIPDIERGEVLMRVLRAGLNHGDLHMREDGITYAPNVNAIPYLPMTIGHDGVGEVVEVGPDVMNVRPGDRAVIMCAITCGFCKYCRTDRQNLCPYHKTMGFVANFGAKKLPERLMRYKDGLWAEYCRVPATNLAPLEPEDDVEVMSKVSQIAVGYRALKRARFHSGETLIVHGGSGITGVGTIISALIMGASRVIAVARNPVPLEQVRAIDPQRVFTVSLGRGESITQRVQELTGGQGASVLADVSPAGAETMIECMKNLEAGGRVTLIAANPELLQIPIRYLMIRNIEFTSTTGRHYADVPELLALARAGVIDTGPITSRSFPLEAANQALDYIKTRGDNDPRWPMYAPGI